MKNNVQMRPLNNLERITEVTKKPKNLNVFEWKFKKLKWQVQNKIITTQTRAQSKTIRKLP